MLFFVGAHLHAHCLISALAINDTTAEVSGEVDGVVADSKVNNVIASATQDDVIA